MYTFFDAHTKLHAQKYTSTLQINNTKIVDYDWAGKNDTKE